MDVTFKIDNTDVTAPEGTGLLDVARSLGITIPALCHHESVPDIAACRLCLVEVLMPGRPQPLLTTSCNYPVAAGIEVTTDSPRIRRHRTMNLQLLLPYAPQAPALREIADQLGVTETLFAPVEDAALPGCILCELCVRVCNTVGFNALSTIGRGDHKVVGPPFEQVAAINCVGCGSCHSVCPTGCITMEDTATTRTIWGRTLDLFNCEQCGQPFMTKAQRTATAARGDLPPEYYNLCDACKRIAVCKDLATAAH